MLRLGRVFSRSCKAIPNAVNTCDLLVLFQSHQAPSHFAGRAAINITRFVSERYLVSGVTQDRENQRPDAPQGDDAAIQELYFSGTAPASDISGPTTLKEMAGKGWGLVASRSLAVGDLVMAVRPLAVLHGPQDSMPSPDSLVEHLRAMWDALSRDQRTAVSGLYGAIGEGAGVATGAEPTTGPRKADAPARAPEPASEPVAAAATEREVDFRAVVSYNAYGDEYEDLPAADLRDAGSEGAAGGGGGGGAGPRSMVGLWPHFSRLNHSCVPNCVHYVVGSTMIVRAVQPVAQGAELLISYLGRDDLAPRQVRQAVLQSRYGFRCDCARCRTEAELPEELQALLRQLYDRSRHELAPRFERLASAAAAAAAADGDLGSEGAATEGDLDLDDDDDDPNDDEAGSGAGASTTAGAGVPTTMTAAEVAKRALRKAGSSVPQWPGAQLAALESPLEECARQLHLAIKELQEDDDAVDEADEAVAAASAAVTPAQPATTAGQLTRVQAAQAAAYQLMELLHLHAELTAAAAAAGGVGGRAASTAAATLSACWHVLDAISRGSELQVFQACKLLSDAFQQSKYSTTASGGSSRRGHSPASSPSGSPPAAPAPPEAVREAAGMLGQSLVARYGQLRGQALGRMTQAAMRVSRGFF